MNQLLVRHDFQKIKCNLSQSKPTKHKHNRGLKPKQSLTLMNREKIIRQLSGHGICRNLNNRILKMEEIYLCSLLQVG